MDTLLHICCAPCSVACVEWLREDGIEPCGFWYNPNIHPFTEYRQRRNSLTEYAETIGLKLIVRNEYVLRPFVRAVCGDLDNRCGYCYRCRMEETARYAAENGFTSFTTTMLVSPYQDRELIIKIGVSMGERYGVSFLPRDFHPRYRDGQRKARELGLYIQKYCGCIFSEEERYIKPSKRVK